jgi:pimeloyl-ACP methyl ester carboxylesterase
VTERLAQVGELELAYETFGDPSDPALLLIMGLGMQMTGWDPEFCGLLADEGFQVIRFDNRDVGHSTKIQDERRVKACCWGTSAPRRTGSRTWQTTRWACSTPSRSTPPTWWALRWAA